MKHGLLHLLGCLIPIALIFILPAFGVSDSVTFTLFIVLMFACHLFMMKGHSHDTAHEPTARNPKTLNPKEDTR